MYYKIINRKKRIATLVADLLGYALWAPFNIFRQRRLDDSEIREILVIRTAYIGDVVMTMPVLRPLRERFPDAKITFLTSTAAKDLLRKNPYVDFVLAYDAFWFYRGAKGFVGFLRELRKKRYDLVIEARADIRDIALLAYAARSRYRMSYGIAGGGFLLTHTVPFEAVKHKVEYHLDLVRYLGAEIDSIDWGIELTKEEYARADALLARTQGAIKVGIHPGGRKLLKSWAPERFAEVADRLIEDGAAVFFSGSSEEEGLIETIIARMRHKAENLAGKADLRTSAAIISRLDLFITNDSAPLHLASAMGTPTVAIFGPSKSNETGPYGNIHRVVEKEYRCRQTCDEDVCLYKNYKECMESISIEDVMKAATEVLEVAKRAGYGVQA